LEWRGNPTTKTLEKKTDERCFFFLVLFYEKRKKKDAKNKTKLTDENWDCGFITYSRSRTPLSLLQQPKKTLSLSLITYWTK